MVAPRKPIVPYTAQLERFVVYAMKTYTSDTAAISAQSVSVACHQSRRTPPISAPPTRWSQNDDGDRETAPAKRYASPTNSVTTFVHAPPLEMRSMTNTHWTTATIDVMNGNSKRRRS